MKVKNLKHYLKDLPEDLDLEFHCENSTDWEVSFWTTADSDKGYTSAGIHLNKPLGADTVCIY